MIVIIIATAIGGIFAYQITQGKLANVLSKPTQAGAPAPARLPFTPKPPSGSLGMIVETPLQPVLDMAYGNRAPVAAVSSPLASNGHPAIATIMEQANGSTILTRDLPMRPVTFNRYYNA